MTGIEILENEESDGLVHCSTVFFSRKQLLFQFQSDKKSKYSQRKESESRRKVTDALFSFCPCFQELSPENQEKENKKRGPKKNKDLEYTAYEKQLFKVCSS